MDHTKIDQADQDSPCRELFNGGLGIITALTVRCQIDFLCVRIADRKSSCMIDPNQRLHRTS